ncbi:hypothetical protein LINPERHAP2_LOCUS33696 [Linum perenne]
MSIAKPPRLPCVEERRRCHMQWFWPPSEAGPTTVSSSNEAVDLRQPLSSLSGRHSPLNPLSPPPPP